MNIEIKLSGKKLWSGSLDQPARFSIISEKSSTDNAKCATFKHKSIGLSEKIDVRLKNSVIEIKSNIQLKDIKNDISYSKGQRITVSVPSSYQLKDNVAVLLEFLNIDEDSEFSSSQSEPATINDEPQNIKDEIESEIKIEHNTYDSVQATKSSKKTKKVVIFSRKSFANIPKRIIHIQDSSELFTWIKSCKNSNLADRTCFIYVPTESGTKFSDKLLITLLVGGYVCNSSILEDLDFLVNRTVECVEKHIKTVSEYTSPLTNALQRNAFHNLESVAKLAEVKYERQCADRLVDVKVHWPFIPSSLWELCGDILGFEFISAPENESEYNLCTAEGRNAFQDLILGSIKS